MFDNVPPGSHHLVIAASGFVPRRLTIDVKGSSFPPLDISLDPELHYIEVLSVSPDARSQFESYQPTSVLSGQDPDTAGAAVYRQRDSQRRKRREGSG